jgi:hypothetical protein
MHGSHCRGLVNEFLQDTSRIGEPFGLEVLSGFRQTPFNALGTGSTNRATELLADLASQIDRSRITTTGASARNRSGGFIAHLGDDRCILGGTGVVCGAAFRIGGLVGNGSRGRPTSRIWSTLRRCRFNCITPGPRGADDSAACRCTGTAASDATPSARSFKSRAVSPAVFGG